MLRDKLAFFASLLSKYFLSNSVMNEWYEYHVETCVLFLFLFYFCNTSNPGKYLTPDLAQIVIYFSFPGTDWMQHFASILLLNRTT